MQLAQVHLRWPKQLALRYPWKLAKGPFFISPAAPN